MCHPTRIVQSPESGGLRKDTLASGLTVARLKVRPGKTPFVSHSRASSCYYYLTQYRSGNLGYRSHSALDDQMGSEIDCPQRVSGGREVLRHLGKLLELLSRSAALGRSKQRESPESLGVQPRAPAAPAYPGDQCRPRLPPSTLQWESPFSRHKSPSLKPGSGPRPRVGPPPRMGPYRFPGAPGDGLLRL